MYNVLSGEKSYFIQHRFLKGGTKDIGWYFNICHLGGQFSLSNSLKKTVKQVT